MYNNDACITSLLRTGITDRVGTTDIYGEHSNIYYRYTGSKLTWVANGGVGTDYEGRTGLPMCDPWDWNMGYDANGNLNYDESHNITNVSYNHLNQPTHICFADGREIDNRYTSAGTKWESIYTHPDGTQSVTKYLGNAVVRDGKLDMLRTPWGYIDGKAHYYVTDYQGNVTHTVNNSAEIEQTVFYYPDGEPWLEPTGKNPYLFGGKERISFAGLRQYDFGARMLNSTVGTWWQVDPKCEDYHPINPYCPMGANPVMNTDPTGAEILGVRGHDAELVEEDLKDILRGEAFNEFRNLITHSGKKINKIADDDLTKALDGVSLTEDQHALVNIVVNAINSSDKHFVEYFSPGRRLSNKAERILAPEMNALGITSEMAQNTPDGYIPFVIHLFGEAMNCPTKDGSLTLIQQDPKVFLTNRPATLGHELIGHGHSYRLGYTDQTSQHILPIKVENLILRNMKVSIQRDGTSHAPLYKYIPDYNALPVY